MKLYRMKQASEITGLHHHTLRELHKKGELIPAKISTGGTRYYSEEQLLKYTQGNNPKPKISIGYCRVSTQKQKDDLDRQVERVTNYMVARGYQFEIIQDIGSCKLQGKRAKKSKELVKELRAND